MRAFLARPEKAPAKMNRVSLVSFKDDTEYILFIEKKLQYECFVDDLIGFVAREFRDFYWVLNDDTCVGVSFQGNFFNGP
jgi:hypothetical protein